MLEQLGKYRIDAILGQGAMGVVYKAFDPHIERVVALKTIRKELFTEARQADLVSRFRNEAQAAGRLQHPNIVMVYDYGEDQDSAYIAMEYVDGAALNTLMLPDQPTAPARIHAWMADLLQALEYAHARGVVHRDIKPANLLITAAARVKVSDFGIARIESSTLTQTGAMIGTPSYMSPEQFRGETVDGRSDVFSAGVLLYQLLTGVRPFVGAPSTVMQQILNQVPAPPSQLLAALGSGYDQILERAMAKAVAERYPSARAFLDALDQVGQAGQHVAPASVLADPDRTVLAAGLHAHPAALASMANDPTLGSGSDAATMTPWKLEAFPQLDAILARQIGPMAKFLLKKVAAKAAGIDDLCDLLLPHIPSELGRVEFQHGVAQLKKKLAASGTGSGAPSSRSTLGGAGLASGLWSGTASGMASAATASTPTMAVPFDADFVAASAQKLTVLIGPIAKVVAQRAARQTNDRNAFLRLLAGHIEAPAERARFLAENGAA